MGSIWHPRSTWNDEQDEFLKAQCQTPASYTEIARAFASQFPNDPKTRNAMLGRAIRKGFRPSGNKPLKYGQTVRKQKTAAANTQRARQIVEKRSLLRAEGDRGIDPTRGKARKLNVLDPVVIERRKGNLPAIIDDKPKTSVPVADACSMSCFWPTKPDCSEVCGARATVGSYCETHALMAYRVMPTIKRNSVRKKDDVEYRVRIDGSHHRDEIDKDGAWLSEQLMAMDEVTIDGPSEGDHPLFIPAFLDSLGD